MEWPGGVAKWIERLTRFTPDAATRLDGLLAALKQPLTDAAAIASLSVATGDALAAIDRGAEARAVYERALATDPTSPELLARFDAIVGSAETPESRVKRYDDAIGASEDGERRVALRVALARLQQEVLKSPDAALETARRAVSDAPQSLAAHRSLVSVLEGLGDDAALVKELKRARATLQGEDRLPPTRKMAEVLMKQDRGDEALALLAPLVDESRLDDETLELIERLADDKAELGTLRQVHEHRIKNASEPPGRARALEAFGELLSGRLDEPVAAAATWKSAAELLAELDDTSNEPIRLYERALRATPNDAGGARRLVELTARAGDWSRVTESITTLLAASDDILDAVPVVLALEVRAVQSGGVDAFASLVDDLVSRLDDEHQAEMRALVTAKARVLAAAGRYDEAARV
jgi:tetratricopeptide (TPR) repeat protein